MNDYPTGMTLRPIHQWPGEMTRARRASAFSAKFSDTLELLRKELRLLEPESRHYPRTVLQIAMDEKDFRIGGMPRAQAKAQHPGIILSIYPNAKGAGELTFPCDTFLTWQDNLRAIALTLEALRKVNRYGVSQSGQQYRGWRAIESGSSVPAGMGPLAAAAFIWTTAGNANDDPHDTPLDRMRANNEVARNVYRAARKNSHPDRNGGDSGTFLRVETAADVLRANGVAV